MSWNETLLFFKESPYQRIAFFTEKDGSFSLTLNDFWQFNSNVEHIYHECLFTMPGLLPAKLENVLVLGGGDGLGARELLKYKSIKSIDLVDLDPEIIKFAKTNVFMKNLNKESFHDPKVNIIVTDAKEWLAKPPTKKYDLVIVDFPDPTDDMLWGLYTKKLYKQIASRLSKKGVVAIQSSTYNTRAYELIFARLSKVFPYLLGYHTGASHIFCGFFIASFNPIRIRRPIPPACKWISPDMINQILALPLYKTEKTKNPDKTIETKPGARLASPQPVVNKIRSQMTERKNLGEEDSGYFATEVLSEEEQTGGTLLMNPAVIAGIVAIIIAPLVLRFI